MAYWNLFLASLLLVSLALTLSALYYSYHERRVVIYAWRGWPYLAAVLVLASTFVHDSELRLFSVLGVVALVVVTLGWVYRAYSGSGARSFWRWQLPGNSLR